MTDRSLLLTIDTATRFAGVALYDGDMICSEAYWQSHNNHSVELMPEIVRILERQKKSAADLLAVAVATGPGSFTGLRIGLSVAKGLALAQKIPILGIPTLDIVAFQHTEQRRPIWAIIQAGRKRLCAAQYVYRRGRWRQRGKMQVTTLEGLCDVIVARSLVCGELTKEAVAFLSERIEADILFASPALSTRRPAGLAELAWERLQQGEQDDLDSLSPLYLYQS